MQASSMHLDASLPKVVCLLTRWSANKTVTEQVSRAAHRAARQPRNDGYLPNGIATWPISRRGQPARWNLRPGTA